MVTHPAPANQALAARYFWTYNAFGMGVAEEYASGGIVVIGDSIDNGGNRLDLGPQIAAITHRRECPISAGRWALLNKLSVLKAQTEVTRSADRLVLVLNTPDLGEPSQ